MPLLILDLDQIDKLAVELFDVHVLGNTHLSDSGWITRTKMVRKAIGWLNPSDSIVRPDVARAMVRRHRHGSEKNLTCSDWIERFDAVAKEVDSNTLMSVGYDDLPTASTDSSRARRTHNQNRPLNRLQAAVRKMETLARIAKENREKEKGDGKPTQ